MTSQLHDVLCVRNAHPRDEHITFQEEGHKYTIHNDLGSTYTSVTTWNHSHFPEFNADKVIDKMMNGKGWKPGHKYWGITKDEIKQQWDTARDEACGRGTIMHYEIECFMNNPSLPSYTHRELRKQYDEEMLNATELVEARNNAEWRYFMKFLEDHLDLKPYRTEWTVYDEELKLSGSIDMVYENPDGTLMIYDWKRSKPITKINNYDDFATTYCISHMPDSNFWHYSLQLNVYKAILEKKYGKKVTALKLVRIHPDCEDDTYEIVDVLDLSKDVRNLFELRKDEVYGPSKKITVHKKSKQT